MATDQQRGPVSFLRISTAQSVVPCIALDPILLSNRLQSSYSLHSNEVKSFFLTTFLIFPVKTKRKRATWYCISTEGDKAAPSTTSYALLDGFHWITIIIVLVRLRHCCFCCLRFFAISTCSSHLLQPPHSLELCCNCNHSFVVWKMTSINSIASDYSLLSPRVSMCTILLRILLYRPQPSDGTRTALN